MTTSPIISLALLALLAAPPAVAAGNDWKTWSDSRFGYSMRYPDHFWAHSRADANDGVTLHGANDETSLAIWGQHNVLGVTGCKQLEVQKGEFSHIVPGSEQCWDGGYTLTVTDDGGRTGIEHHTVEYGLVSPQTIAAFSYTYRPDATVGAEDLLAEMKEGLRLADGDTPLLASSPLPGVDLKNWQSPYVLLDGNKFGRSNGAPLGEVLPVQNSDILVWFAVGPDTAGATAAEYGLYFADQELERIVSFLPCDLSDLAGTVRMSPAGTYLLVDFGTGPVRDIRLYDFRSLRLLRSFTGMESIAWFDNGRFVFTHVESTGRENGTPACSVAVYDVPVDNLQIVQQATPTADFFCNGLNMDKEQIDVQERTLPLPGAKEGEGQTRSLGIPFPAAG